MGYKVLDYGSTLCPARPYQYGHNIEVLTSDLPSHNQAQSERQCPTIERATPSRRWSGISINSFCWSLMTKSVALHCCWASRPPLTHTLHCVLILGFTWTFPLMHTELWNISKARCRLGIGQFGHHLAVLSHKRACSLILFNEKRVTFCLYINAPSFCKGCMILVQHGIFSHISIV